MRAAGDRLQRGLAAAEGGKSAGALPLHEGHERLAEQLAAFAHTGEFMGSGQQDVVEGDGGAVGAGQHHDVLARDAQLQAPSHRH